MSVKIGITGHRKLEDKDKVKAQIQNAIQDILQKTGDKNFYAYTCLAAGSDSLFAEAAAQSGGMIKAVLPFAREEYLKDFDADEADIFRKLMATDNNPFLINPAIPATTKDRNESYLEAGKYVVNHSDYVIAVWDGEKGNGVGGTADVVAYARSTAKPVVHIKACRSDISRLYLYYDKKAIVSKKIYEWLWKISIISSLSAALILAFYISFNLSDYKVTMAKIEFAAVIVSLAIISYLKVSKLNKNRILYRRAAERLRVLEKFDNSCIPVKPLAYFLDMPDLDNLEKKYQDLSRSQTDFEKSRRFLLYLVQEQIDYHTKMRPEIKSKTSHFLEKIQLRLLILFFAGVFCHFGSVFLEEGFVSRLLDEAGLMLSLSIPPIYAAIEGYIYFKEYHKIAIDSDKMQGFFTNMKTAINNIDGNSDRNFAFLNGYAFQIRENMDSETKDWSVLFEHKGAPGI